jgi:phosphohistidine phosphatase
LRAAHKIGEVLRDAALIPDLVLSSTAERARATAETATRQAGYPGQVELLPELYLAEPPAYFDALRKLTNDASRVLVVGHNPGIEALLYRLSGKAEHMPTGALAELELGISAWAELGPETRGTLVRVFRPKALDD